MTYYAHLWDERQVREQEAWEAEIARERFGEWDAPSGSHREPLGPWQGPPTEIEWLDDRLDTLERRFRAYWRGTSHRPDGTTIHHTRDPERMPSSKLAAIHAQITGLRARYVALIRGRK